MFNEANTVEQMVLDTLCGSVSENMVAEERPHYGGDIKSWRFVPAEQLPRQHAHVLVESMVRDALIRLNPEIQVQPDRADEVLYRLRAMLLSVRRAKVWCGPTSCSPSGCGAKNPCPLASVASIPRYA